MPACPSARRASSTPSAGCPNDEASSSGAYRFRYDYWQGLQSGNDTWDFVVPNFINFHERNTHPVYPDGFLPYEESEIADFAIAGGMRNRVADWDVDVSLAYGANEFAFSASNTINASIGAQYLADNPGAGIPGIVANAGAPRRQQRQHQVQPTLV